MPKHTVTLTAREIIAIVGTDEIVDHVIEYAGDNDFPANTDLETIKLDGVRYNTSGEAELTFEFSEEPDEDEDSDEEDAADQKNDEVRDEK